MVTEDDLAYVGSQRLARLATVSPDGQPTVDAVGCQFDGERFVVAGHDLPGSRKYRNIPAGNQSVALIVDDLAATDPWTPRRIKVHGMAEIVARDGVFGTGGLCRDYPMVSWNWGIVAPAFGDQGAAFH